MPSQGRIAVARRVMLGLSSYVIACGPALGLGYDEFSLNWLTPDGNLVSVSEKSEVVGSMKRDPDTGFITSVAFAFQLPVGRVSCTITADMSIECENSHRVSATIYKYVKAETVDEFGRARLSNEPGRIYKQFRARHNGKGVAGGYFVCRANCERKPMWIVPVWLGD